MSKVNCTPNSLQLYFILSDFDLFLPIYLKKQRFFSAVVLVCAHQIVRIYSLIVKDNEYVP